MADFYMVLPSNTGDFETNTASQFRVQLPNALNLSGSDWKVGLSEIIYPYSWLNIDSKVEDKSWPTSLIWVGKREPVTKKVKSVTHDADGGKTKEIQEVVSYEAAPFETHLPSANYDTTESLVDALNSTLKGYATFHFSKFKPITVTFTQECEYLYLSHRLQHMLGFRSQNVNALYQATSSFSGDLRAGVYTLFVYLDIVKNSVVGNTLAPLLHCVAIEGRHGEIVHKSFPFPHYVPVEKRDITTINVSIKDDSGRNIRFTFGKTLIKLHFKNG